MQHRHGGAEAAQVLPRILTACLSAGLPTLACVLAVPAQAQSSPADTSAPAPSSLTLSEMVRQRQNELAAAWVTQLARSLPPSLPAALGLDERQVERLDRLYADFLLARVEQEGKIARWQADLRRAQSPAEFNESRARGLLKSIAEAQDKVRAAFLKARGEALKALSSAQRAQVHALAASLSPNEQAGLFSSGAGLDEVPSVRVDEYRALLLLPAEKLLETPLDTAAARRVLAERASGRYSSYGYSSGRYGRSGYSRGLGGFGWGAGRSFEFGGIYGHFGHRNGFSSHPQHGGAPH